jgi:hypothetical protein
MIDRIRHNRKPIFFLGVFFLLLALGGGLLLSTRSFPRERDQQGVSGSDVAPPATPTLQPAAVVESEWPRTMEMGRSDWIRVSIVWPVGGTYVPTLEVTEHAGSAATPIPHGTAHVSPESAFGEGYRAEAIARLDAAAFDCRPEEMDYLALEPPRVDFTWNCLPRYSGRQRVNASLDVRWSLVAGTGPVTRQQIWRARFEIDVTDPWLKTHPLQLFSAISGFLGSVLVLPLFVSFLRGKTGPTRGTLDAEASIPYDLGALRRLLLAAFTHEELRRFCQDRPLFRPVVAHFAPDHGLDDLVDEVMDYCRTRYLWPDLLAEIAKENPRQYARFEPDLSAAEPSPPRDAE